MCGEAESLRRRLDAESSRFAEAREAFAAEAAAAAAASADEARAEAARAGALESAEASARLGNATAEIETLKVRLRTCVVRVVYVCLCLQHVFLK